MFNEATDALKFDNRLRARRGWVLPDEVAQELAALPDSRDKALALGEEPAAKPSAASAASAAPVPSVVEEPPAEPQSTTSFGSASDDAADTGSDFGGTHDA